MISIHDCKDGYLYLIHARNARLGVFRLRDHSFLISRFKFSDNYIWPEYHWDVGTIRPEDTQFGTAKPYVELCRVWTDYNNYPLLLKYLNEYYQNHRTIIDEMFYDCLDDDTRKIYHDYDNT